jgi:hypothetical protein
MHLHLAREGGERHRRSAATAAAAHQELDPAVVAPDLAGEGGDPSRAAMDPAAPCAWPPEREEGAAPPWIQPPPRAWPPERKEGPTPPWIQPHPRA